jgi:hypothetical protein
VTLTLSQSAQWTQTTQLRDQIQLLALVHCNLTVQRSLTIKEIAALLCVKTTQVKRQLQELDLVRGDLTAGDDPPRFLSTIGRLTQDKERLKAEVTALKTRVYRLEKSRDDAQAGCHDLHETVLRLEAECSCRDAVIQSLTRDRAALSGELAFYAENEFVRIAPEFTGCPVFWPNLRRHFLAWNDLFLRSFAYWDRDRLKQIEYPAAVLRVSWNQIEGKSKQNEQSPSER